MGRAVHVLSSPPKMPEIEEVQTRETPPAQEYPMIQQKLDFNSLARARKVNK